VATGLGDQVGRASLQVVDSPKSLDTSDDYKNLDRPTIMRNKPVVREESEVAQSRNKTAEAGSADQNMDYFDIPAFLRRQAD